MSNDDGELVRIVYTSTADHRFSVRDLQLLVAKGRQNNVRDGVTGLLLFHEGCFMQVLEGPRRTVEATYLRIRRNSLHHNIIELMNEPVDERLFSGNGMYLADTRDLDEDVQVSPLLRDAHWLDRVADSDTAIILLRSFRSQLRPGDRTA